MDINDKKIEFLAQKSNLKFLLEIHGLIDSAKELFYRNQFNMFIKDYIESNINEFATNYIIEQNVDEFFIRHKKFKDNQYLSFYIYLGAWDQNIYYGISGNEENFDLKISELLKLKDKLKASGVTRRWKYLIAYKFFNRERDRLLDISSDAELNIFFEDLSDEFWAFVEEIRELLEKTNLSIKKKRGLK